MTSDSDTHCSSSTGWSNIKFDFAGAHVLVTGGTSGIGAGVARAYRAARAHVTVTGTRKSAGEYQEPVQADRYLQLNVEDKSQIDAVAASLDRLDIIVHCAGTTMLTLGLDEWEPEIFDRAVAMHLTSVYRLSKRCLPLLSKSRLPGGGSVIGIASMASYFGIGHVPAYGAAKAGIVQLMMTMALKWAKENVRANAVAPGLTLTPLTKYRLDRNPGAREKTLERMPLGRFGEPQDIAGPILFLTSAAAAFITGQTVIADAGYSIYG